MRLEKLLALFLATSALPACSGYSSTGGPGSNVTPSLVSHVGNDTALLHVNSLLVAPIQIEERARSSGSGREGRPFYEQLERAFREESNLEVIADVRLFPSADKMSVKEALEAGRRQNADAVILTRLHNFVEREGSNVGVSQPASVDFSMQMLSVRTGQPIWEASYHFKDQALSDNLLRIEDRFKDGRAPRWRTAEDILRDGLREASRDFSKRRSAQFHGPRL